MKTLKECQDLFQDVEAERKRYQRYVEDQVDKAFLMDVARADKALEEREAREAAQRRAIANQQTEWNFKIAEEKRAGLERKKERDEDYRRSVEELEQYKKDEQARYQKMRQDQADYLQYLYGQDRERAEQQAKLRQEDVDYANAQTAKLQSDR